MILFMQVSKLERSNPLITENINQESITEKVSAVGTYILQYFVRNKYAVTLSVWTYALIEISMATSDSIMSGNYVYDAASCRRTLCEYANQYTYANQTSEEMFNLIETCNLSSEDFSLSFMDCLHDLCIFLEHLGEKFYACIGNFASDNEILENQILTDPNTTPMQFWNSVCPKRHIKHLTDLKKLMYFKDCLKNICTDNNIVSLLNDETLSLCNSEKEGYFFYYRAH